MAKRPGGLRSLFKIPPGLHRAARGGSIGLAMFIVGLVIFAGLPTSTYHPTTTTSTTTTTVPVINRASYRVQVYNGTAVSGAAGTTTNKLRLDGWATMPAVTSNTTVVRSIVAYAPGDRAAAIMCAQDLGLPTSVVTPLTLSTANPLPAAGTNIVVIVGPDLAG
jgi:LytR cell envelope-related transcriptional attenuator